VSQKLLKSVVVSMALLAAASVSAADRAKDEETLRDAHSTLRAMLDSKSVPIDYLLKAECIIVTPNVKKFGVGVGGGGGRGPMLCKTGPNGTWSAPAMFTVSGMSIGLQVGGSSTDYVLLVMNKKAVDALLKGKTALGRDATAAAGPGATATGDVGTDILTYGRSSGVFAGVSISGATFEPDNEANKRLYGKDLTAEDIVIKNSVPATEGGKPLDKLLDSKTARPAAKPSKPAPTKK
jgi:lipid-binding SYLF domain-containing protein